MRALRMAMTVVVGVLILSMIASAQVTFTPQGSNTKFTGKMFDMLQTSVAQRHNVTGSILVGREPTHKQWAMRVRVRNVQPNSSFVLALASAHSTKVLIRGTSAGNGTLQLTWVGSTDPMSFTDIALYYEPSTSDKPQAGAIRLLSIQSSMLGSIKSGSY